MVTPHGIGEPSILWPETAIESMGFSKQTCGAFSMNGSIIAKSAPSQCTCAGGGEPL